MPKTLEANEDVLGINERIVIAQKWARDWFTHPPHSRTRDTLSHTIMRAIEEALEVANEHRTSPAA